MNQHRFPTPDTIKPGDTIVVVYEARNASTGRKTAERVERVERFTVDRLTATQWLDTNGNRYHRDRLPHVKTYGYAGGDYERRRVRAVYDTPDAELFCRSANDLSRVADRIRHTSGYVDAEDPARALEALDDLALDLAAARAIVHEIIPTLED